MKKLIVSLIALPFVFAAAKAEITMPKIFSDNMVIQRNAPVKIWGKADPKSRVAVEIGDIRRISGADKDGFWSITLPPLFESDKPRELTVYENGKPIYYEFTSCPAAEFAIKHGLTDIMPALCNVDFASMELLHARLIRTTTCVNGCRCDYTICGDKDPYLKGHPEYRDEAGFRRNR